MHRLRQVAHGAAFHQHFNDKRRAEIEVGGERVGGKLEERFGAVDDAIGGVIDEAARLQALAVAHLGDRRGAAGLAVKMDKEVGALAEIGRASCRAECVSTCRSRWSPYT